MRRWGFQAPVDPAAVNVSGKMPLQDGMAGIDIFQPVHYRNPVGLIRFDSFVPHLLDANATLKGVYVMLGIPQAGNERQIQ